MDKQRHAAYGLATLALAVMALQPTSGLAQVPVDEDGKVIGAYEPALETVNEGIDTGNVDVPLMSAIDLEELVGPVALYPDDLLAIILPASAYPQQIIDAGRFLQDLENDSSLQPDPQWDDSVVALLNYPEVIELMNDDIDWTWRLGEAVIAQQSDVLAAIETFRDRAYNAGNLKSDEYQTVARNNGIIEITPVEDDVIYVPYYEPQRVVVYQPRPVYYYYPRSYPIYYYPYTSAYHFNRGYFWGVTTAFSIGWYTDSLHVYHHSYHGHPYFGHRYRDHYWYRRPTMHHYRNNYIGNSTVTVNNYYSGDRWRPRRDRHSYVRQDRRSANNRYMANREASRQAAERRRSAERRARSQQVNRQRPVTLRDRPDDFRARTEGQRSRAQTQREQYSRDQRQQPSQRRDLVAQQRRETSRTAGQQRRNPTPQASQQRREQRTAPQAQRRVERATPQRQQRTTPQAQRRVDRATPQRQQRTAPQAQRRVERATPQRQQRTAPQRQQRSAPPPQTQQRSAPVPQQQRSAPPPQREARSGSRSSQKKSEGRRSERRR